VTVERELVEAEHCEGEQVKESHRAAVQRHVVFALRTTVSIMLYAAMLLLAERLFPDAPGSFRLGHIAWGSAWPILGKVGAFVFVPLLLGCLTYSLMVPRVGDWAPMVGRMKAGFMGGAVFGSTSLFELYAFFGAAAKAHALMTIWVTLASGVGGAFLALLYNVRHPVAPPPTETRARKDNTR
jgi:hypothetical protein